MKVLTQILTFLVAISLMSTNPTLARHASQDALAQNQATLMALAQLAQRTTADTALRRQMVAHDVDTARVTAEENLKIAKVNLALARAKPGSSGVLMVLTEAMKAEDVAATTEDLNIMSRIFEKKLEPAYATHSARLPSTSNVDRLFRNLRYRSTSHGTQAIYLHGYGALFLMSVDFPLSPPPQLEAEKVHEGADPVWEQTKLRITASDGDLPLAYVHERDAVARPYDPDKVEQLKATLIKALKHAANIRNLKPDESVILVVAGTLPAVVVAEHGDERHRYQYIQYTQRHARPAMLTIRAKKAEIDAYSADTIDYEQFHQQVQILTAHINLGPERAGVMSLSAQ